jgi:hypothetical protein
MTAPSETIVDLEKLQFAFVNGKMSLKEHGEKIQKLRNSN